MDVKEKLVELLTNSPQLDVLDWTTGWEEAANYLIAHGVTVQEQKSPCSLCGYGGKHLDSPPCTQCPAHPKEQPNANQRNSNASNVQEWISVKDRLPENIANRVLVVCERSNGVFYAHYEKPFWINLETDKPFISTVTHWMPLPELPKENDYETD